MSDSVNLRQRIADELSRQPTDIIGSPSLSLNYVVNREIDDAIRHYEATRLRWNEKREHEFATTTSGGRTISLPATFIGMDTLKLVYNGSYIRVNKRTWAEIEDMDTEVSAADGPPTLFALYGNVIRLFPVPNGSYTLVGSYVMRFPPTSLTGSYCGIITMGGGSLTVTTTASHNNRLNGWTTDGEALIRARARASVEINYLNVESAITEMRQLQAQNQPYLCIRERIAFERLVAETNKAQATGYIKPSRI